MANIAIVDKAPSAVNYSRYFNFEFDNYHLSSKKVKKLLKKDVDLAQKKKINIDQEVDNLDSNQNPDYDPAGQLEGNLGTLRGIIKNIESEQEKKKDLMGTMNTLLKEMLKGQKRTVATQVDEA